MNPRVVLATNLITILGTSLSSISIFLSIEAHFGSIVFLGLALSLKTIFNFFIANKVKLAINEVGLRQGFILGESFGILSLAIVAIGFYFNSIILVLSGVVFGGIPLLVCRVTYTAFVRLGTSTSSEFRRFTGMRVSLSGVAMITAALAAPVLLKHFGIYWVLICDLITFTGSIFVVSLLSKNKSRIKLSPRTTDVADTHLDLKPEFYKFYGYGAAALILIGFVPIIASSQNVDITMHLPTMLREWMWSVERLSFVVAGLVYARYSNILSGGTIKNVFSLSALFLVIISIFDLPILALFLAIFIPLSFELTFTHFRDELVEKYGTDEETTTNISTSCERFRFLLAGVSPLLLSGLYQILTTRELGIVILGFQISAVIMGNKLFHMKRDRSM